MLKSKMLLECKMEENGPFHEYHVVEVEGWSL